MRRAMLVRIAAAALVVVAFASLVVAFRTPPAIAASRRVDASLGNWHFQHSVPATDPEGVYNILVDYPKGTAAEVRAAAAAMNGYAAQLAQKNEPFKATIVFTRPLTTAEFKEFAADRSIEPTGSIVRLVQPDGQRVTMGVSPVWTKDDQGRRKIGKPGPAYAPFNDGAFERARQRHPENRVIGIISTDVILDFGTYQRVQHDPRVFGVDVLQHVVTEKVRQQFPGVDAKDINVQASQLYWAMEDTKLVVSK